MARQDGYNYFNGAPPPGKRRLTKRERFLAAGLAAVLLLAWAGWTLQARLYPGWRLEGLFPKERIVEIHVEQRQRESGAVVAERTLSPQEQEAFYQAIGQTTLWMNNPAYRQLMAGNFLDILFDCPYEMHNLTADAFVSRMVEELSEEHKEVLYFLSLRLYSTTRLAAVRGQSDRNIRKLRKTIHKKLQRQMYDHLCGKQEHGGSLTLRERQFLEEYSKIARKQGKDAVIRRENKTKRRKKKNRP